jgi:hypothetical protein
VVSPAQSQKGLTEAGVTEVSARTFLALLSEGKYSDAADICDDEMRRAAPPDKLKEIWKGLISKTGALRNQLDSEISSVEEGGEQFKIVLITCEFERGRLRARVVLNSDNRVAGLFFVSAQQ